MLESIGCDTFLNNMFMDFHTLSKLLNQVNSRKLGKDLAVITEHASQGTRIYRIVSSITHCSNSNLQTYIRSNISQERLVPIYGFSAASAHGLAMHVSMCPNEQRQEPLRANVDLCKITTVLLFRFEHAMLPHSN